MLDLFFGFITAFLITYLAIPPVIRIAVDKHLFDKPGHRSSHFVATPSIGGVGIFAGFLIAVLLWVPFQAYAHLQYIIGAVLVIFMMGLKDDLAPMAAKKKLLIQIAVAILLAIASDIRIASFQGMLGWWNDMPYALSLILSVFTILVITNAFNLIDGINGLSSSLGIFACLLLGTWFYGSGFQELAILASITAGAYTAFLPFNVIPPAKTFMGDTGSLLLGTMTAILTISFIEKSAALSPSHPWKFDAVPVLAMSVIVVPLFDTIRVFSTRIYRGSSPFTPDRRHIHHLLLDFGLSHTQATLSLLLFTALITAIALTGQYFLERHLLLALLLLITGGTTYWLHEAVKRRRRMFKLRSIQAIRNQRKQNQG